MPGMPTFSSQGSTLLRLMPRLTGPPELLAITPARQMFGQVALGSASPARGEGGAERLSQLSSAGGPAASKCTRLPAVDVQHAGPISRGRTVQGHHVAQGQAARPPAKPEQPAPAAHAGRHCGVAAGPDAGLDNPRRSAGRRLAERSTAEQQQPAGCSTLVAPGRRAQGVSPGRAAQALQPVGHSRSPAAGRGSPWRPGCMRTTSPSRASPSSGTRASDGAPWAGPPATCGATSASSWTATPVRGRRAAGRCPGAAAGREAVALVPQKIPSSRGPAWCPQTASGAG